MPPRPQIVRARALLLGDRISPEIPADWAAVASHPILLEAPGGGHAAVLRYGAVVFFEVSPDDQHELCQALVVREPLADREREDVEIRVSADQAEQVEASTLSVPDLALPRLQLIAEALAKSVVLEHYERAIAETFDRIEPLARELDQRRQPGRLTRALLRHIGAALLAEQRMSGRVEMREKPDLLWDQPALERFYLRLEDEYELHERAVELDRKLELISRTARTALDLLQHRRSLRVEWYIVILIVIEILLTLHEKWWQ